MLLSFAAALLWYSGHGQKDTGNWCFEDGFISFDDIYNIYQAHFRGRLLMIVTDCCYAGQWVLRFKEKIGRKLVSKSEAEEMLLKVYASCQPNEKSYDGIFSSRSVYTEPQRKTMLFDSNTIRVNIRDSQTPCLIDITEMMSHKKDCSIFWTILLIIVYCILTLISGIFEQFHAK